MSQKENLKRRLSQATSSLTSNWKKTLLIGAGVLLVGGAGVAVGVKLGHEGIEQAIESRFEGDFRQVDDKKEKDQDNDWSEGAQALMTYDEWKTAIDQSALSTADKKTFQAALEKAKDKITEADKLKTQLESLYKNSFEQLESDYSKLLDSHSSLWAKLDEQPSQNLEDLEQDDLTDLKQEISQSNLSDDEKSSLIKDIDQMKFLKANYSTAYESYVSQASKLETELTTAQNAVSTTLKDNKVTDSMLEEVLGGHGSWKDSEDDNQWG
ncbi:hypothetical protein [Streptococcus saliviloxodontae]|uniref:Vacuolar-type H+-ATPase subunit I/STV1 n=1 Tax=Streptococcus saliviloxodontae TaxID=1349416 RepID=A0ABS2PJT5_9STRE|nr:hypothetical protein [Streptococcus saliviloxodontae]MBM7635688.1 vacuolar-type H+-ATPase subunit I/STV1 [Streptococcus saliviloxodontae]